MDRASYKVFYDGKCRICRRSRQMIERMQPSESVEFVDVNNRLVMAAYPQLADADVKGQMHVIDPSGRLTGGYDAMVALTPALPPLNLLMWLLNLAPVRAIGRALYRWLAANRYRLGGQVSCHERACSLDSLR